MSTRIRRCSNEKEFEQVIDEFIMLGYELQTRGNDNALLIKRKKKEHGLVALLTVWWSLGIGNLIYACVPAKIIDEVMVRLDKGE
ncbi:MAG: hypothetical protein E7501_03170 [Ruminococcus sp.]|nr:hypothetical protein [Ruminococcus sp.]